MKFQIKNRFSGEVQFECELDAGIADKSYSVRLGFAVRKAIEAKDDLSWADLSRADLSWANLSRADLSLADLSRADLSRADLSRADLSWANLSLADLSRADLSEADLSRVDWIPRIPDIHKAVYAAASAPNALDMSQWYTCGTTHCRAGWVTTLAGDCGRVLEGVYGTSAAAALIYAASDPNLGRVPDFHATDEEALADMKRLAEQE